MNLLIATCTYRMQEHVIYLALPLFLLCCCLLHPRKFGEKIWDDMLPSRIGSIGGSNGQMLRICGITPRNCSTMVTTRLM
jgi:hypothetical protein